MGCALSNNQKIGSLEVNESTLSDFLEIEKSIAEAEEKNPIKPLDVKAGQLVQLTEKIEILRDKLKDLEIQTKSSAEKQSDDVETHRFFMEKGVDDELNSDQLMFLDLLNEKEITSKELETAAEQFKEVSLEVEQLEQQAIYLDKLYEKQDKLLGQIFNGEYGSVIEKRLENELDLLEAQRGRILEANFKWRQAQMMLEYACKQLSITVKRWQELPGVPNSDLEKRYSIAADVRNNVVAAGQNLSGAKRYLSNVEFPYCDPEEVITLNKAAQYVFTDMQIADRYEHAKECYITIYKRANALLQWFDTVINTTIMSDLHEINTAVKEKALELRKERVQLIRAKVKESFGTDLTLDQSLRDRNISTAEMAKAMLSENQVVKVGNQNSLSKGIRSPPLLTKEELAPLPSNSTIFGNTYSSSKAHIESLAKKHHEDLQTFLKDQELREARMKGAFEEKLMARRQKRARMKMEESQKLALQS